MHIFSIFFKKFNKHVLIFRAFGRKTQIIGKFGESMQIFQENSIEKLNFSIIFGKFVTKNRAFGNNNLFLQHFFGFGSDFPIFPPGYAPVL